MNTMRLSLGVAAGLLGCLLAGQASAIALSPIVALCSKANALPFVVNSLRSDGWQPITRQDFETFAEMQADDYISIGLTPLPKHMDDPIGRTWPEMVEKLSLHEDAFFDPSRDFSVLTKTDGQQAFIVVGAQSGVDCRLLLRAGSFDQSEVETMLGSSAKKPMAVGYSESRFVLDTSSQRQHYQLIARWMTDDELAKAGSAAPKTNLVFVIGQFDQK